MTTHGVVPFCIMVGVEETVRYTYRLRPGVQAERALLAEWDRCRWLWNEAVHMRKTGQRPTSARLCKLLTDARKRIPWLREGSQNAQANVLRTYGVALDRSFKVKGCGKPKVKKKDKAQPSLEYTTRGFRIREQRLCLPGGVTVPVVWSRDLPSDPTSVRVYRDSLGYWYASFVVRREAEAAPEADGSIGIDWGVSRTVTATERAYDLPYQGFRARSQAELAKAQRKMARRHKRGVAPSKGYQRAKRDAAKLHKKAARQNIHAGREWARQVVADHQTIAVEAFRPKFLSRTKMARKAADATIGILKTTLVEQATRAGRKVVLVPPAYTTMTCSRCDARATQRLPLSERTFRCEFCGFSADRDENAARVILARVERDPASVDGVSHCATSLRGESVVMQPELEIPARTGPGNPPDSSVGKR